MKKLRLAVHKFTSCDGCQLALLNMGEDLLQLAQRVDIVHFPEAGPVDPGAEVDIALVEGSISTGDEFQRIQAVRHNSKILVSIGACATSGGIQALRNLSNPDEWLSHIYSQPEFIDRIVNNLDSSVAIAEYVRVDFELWGCPINGRQISLLLNDYLLGVSPVDATEKVCLECKRQQTVCVMVTQAQACMGPVTRTGCGALCPRYGRDCYACYGPAENLNTQALSNRFKGFGLLNEDIARRFRLMHSQAPAFNNAASQVENPDV